ncbi:GTP-binding protein [Candidatus Micrarchaeota archaeon CG11_big_fil_rev_8_21_14_0_20_47_5]|nr:MAG: GTP-binding protein [Candidatus Micrarchaeota archaeon CG1_02_47_40]PIN84013.1 MAG: GTP-binding protein [Candidatus Micrarchaeota archaeon CG11_big_fil_rev_8_21_14_0_20_47_5]
MGIADKIKEIDDEIHRTQKNKATEYHLGLLKAKIAKLKREQFERTSSGGGGGGGGFAAKKSGDATVVFIGWPSVGKSTLLNALTNAESKIAAYQFTTLTCIPGIMEYNGAQIQLLDLPGILEGAHEGRGKGREVLSVARNADLVLILLDVFRPDPTPIMTELEAIGIRLDRKPPNISIGKRARGGVEINSTVSRTKLDERIIMGILNEYGIHNASVVLREDIDADQLIDALVKNRKYIPSITVLNKTDLVSRDYLKSLRFPFVPVSADKKENIEELKEQIYKKLNLIRIYTKPKGGEADMKRPLMMLSNSTISDVAKRLGIRKEQILKGAQVWGKSARFPGQKLGGEHILADGDVLTLQFANA